MQGNKVINLLIVMFIIVNIGLGIGNYEKHVNTYKLDNEQIETITALLEQQGVTIQCELPRSFEPAAPVWLEPLEIDTRMRDSLIRVLLNEKLSQVMVTKEQSQVLGEELLVYKYNNRELKFSKEKVFYIDHNIEQQSASTDEKTLLATANDFFDRLPMKEDYKKVKINHKIESYGAEITYYEVYKGFPLFDSYVRMQVTPKGVYSVEIKDIKQSDKIGKTQVIYPINKVLFELVGDLTIEPPAVITDVQLGYIIKNMDGMHLVEEEAIPMYKVRIQGLNEPLFVNAYTNEIE